MCLIDKAVKEALKKIILKLNLILITLLDSQTLDLPCQKEIKVANLKKIQ